MGKHSPTTKRRKIGQQPTKATPRGSEAEHTCHLSDATDIEQDELSISLDRFTGRRGRKRTHATWTALMMFAVTLSFVAFGMFVMAELAYFPDLNHAFAMGAASVATVAVLMTYLIGGRTRYSKHWAAFQPLKGGIRFVTFQIIGWTFFGLFLVLPVLPYVLATFFPEQTFRGIAISAGAAALLSEVSVLASLLLYRPATADAKVEQSLLPKLHGLQGFLISESGQRWWSSFVGIQVLLTIVGLGLAVVADLLRAESWAWVFAGCFALSCFVFSAFSTYGIGGPWKHYYAEWKFYQPGIGGYKFVALQALSWTLFSVSVCVFIVHFLSQLPAFEATFDGKLLEAAPSMTSAGIAALLSQLFLTSSLFVYKVPADMAKGKQDPVWKRLFRVLLVAFFYNTQIIVGSAVCGSLILAPTFPHTIVIGWAVISILYIPTYFWSPGVTGRRAFKPESLRWIFDIGVSYFDLKLFRMHDKPYTFDNDEKYILGYHPHGIMPFSCAWSTLNSQWASMFPELQPAYLTATVTHAIPFLRDLGEFIGGYEVTIHGFLSALKNRRCVLLVPGGQSEMLDSRADTNEVVLNTRHLGFIRVALMTGSHLVPMVAFDETALLSNIKVPRSVQEWCVRHFRTNFFTFPVGVAYLPIPRPLPYSLVIGKPIAVPKIENPSDEIVEALHRHYYTAVMEMFEQYKVKCDHPNDHLILKPDLEPLDTNGWKEALIHEAELGPLTQTDATDKEDSVTREHKQASQHHQSSDTEHKPTASEPKHGRKHHHHRHRSAMKPKNITMFEMFSRVELGWVFGFLTLVYVVVLIRAWPYLQISSWLGLEPVSSWF